MQFQFASFVDFLAMDGHGIYVWIAYGISFVAMAALVIQPGLRRSRLQREEARQQRIQQRRQKWERTRAEQAVSE